MSSSGQHDVQFPDKVARTDHTLWLAMGRPPADTTAFSSLLVALQDIQDDVNEFMRLRGHRTEYLLTLHPSGSAGLSRHRDAAPDDGSEDVGRRVTAMVCCNADWEREGGGAIRIWPPRRAPPAAVSVSGRMSRRSPAGSDAGTSYSEASDSYSLRSHWFGGSTTSSMVAEVPPPEHDNCSVETGSVAESLETVERVGLEWLESDGEMVLDVAPVAGRLVLVLSGAVEHAHQPTLQDVALLTAWFT